MDYRGADFKASEDKPKYDSYKPNIPSDTPKMENFESRPRVRGILDVDRFPPRSPSPPYRNEMRHIGEHRALPTLTTKRVWSPSRRRRSPDGRFYTPNRRSASFRERKGGLFDRGRPTYPTRERNADSERGDFVQGYPQGTTDLTRKGSRVFSQEEHNRSTSTSTFDPNYAPKIFMPIVLTMPDVPMRMRFRYVLRLHSNHNPGGALSRIERLFDVEVRLSRREQQSRDDVVNALARVLNEKMHVSHPYSDTNQWVFLVTARIIRGIPDLIEGQESKDWPFVPVTFDGKNGYMISVVSRYGPPYLDVLLNWVRDSGNAGLVGGDCLAEYSAMVSDEKRLDSKAMGTNSYITHLANGQLKRTQGYKHSHTNRDRDRDLQEPHSAKKRNFSLETPGKSEHTHENGSQIENDDDERYQRTQENYKKMKLDDEVDRSDESMAQLDMQDLP